MKNKLAKTLYLNKINEASEKLRGLNLIIERELENLTKKKFDSPQLRYRAYVNCEKQNTVKRNLDKQLRAVRRLLNEISSSLVYIPVPRERDNTFARIEAAKSKLKEEYYKVFNISEDEFRNIEVKDYRSNRPKFFPNEIKRKPARSELSGKSEEDYEITIEVPIKKDTSPIIFIHHMYLDDREPKKMPIREGNYRGMEMMGPYLVLKEEEFEEKFELFPSKKDRIADFMTKEEIKSAYKHCKRN